MDLSTAIAVAKAHVKPSVHTMLKTLHMAAAKKGFCLISNGDSLSLDTKHPYYYQVQAQLFVCDVEYCDFVVWTQRDIHIERIVPDIVFWEEALLKSTKLFNVAVLPELVGRWFTRPSVVTNAVDQCESDDEEGCCNFVNWCNFFSTFNSHQFYW